MKTVKFVFGLIMVLALISGSVVVAQEVELPLEEEQAVLPAHDPYIGRELIPPTEGPILDPVLDPDGGVAATEDLPRMEPQPHPVSEIPEVDLRGMPDETDIEAGDWIEPLVPSSHNEFIAPEGMDTIPGEVERDLDFETGFIYVGTTARAEYSPDVAHGGNRYVVVFKDAGNIRYKVYSNAGSYLTGGLVRDCSPHYCYFPTVAYDAKSGLFLVAYEYWNGSHCQIHHQALTPVTGPIGPIVSTTYLSNKWWPSAACNSVNGSCLVAHENRTTNQIDGVWLGLNNSGISSYSGIISLENTTDDVGVPYLAWGKGTGRYMLTYRRYISGQWRPYYQHLYDVYVAPPQFSHGPAFVVPATFVPGKPTYPTGVTYDPCTKKFAIVFTNEWSTSIFDVWVAFKHATAALGSGYSDVAYTTTKDHSAKISFVTDPHLTPACGRMDKLVVIYKNDGAGGLILATDLRGNNSTTNPVYVIDPEYKHKVVVADVGAIFKAYIPAISSGSTKANLFAVFEADYPTSGGLNVYGRILKVPDKNFLPLLVK